METLFRKNEDSRGHEKPEFVLINLVREDNFHGKRSEGQ
jgi:hypothetical protein